MAASVLASEQAQEVFSWLRALPLAPEYHPTLVEFQDPISYIFKIEKEASKYGICKIVPPVLPSPKKTVIANLNRSLAARAVVSEGNFSESRPVFTTRQQQIGFCPRKSSPVQKPVWQSGEHYTFQQFEAKAKTFEKNYLKKCAKKGALSALEIESLYWKATVDKPFSVEYANDMPGSAFIPINAGKCKDAGEGVTLGETAWNMRGVSRSKGSLLRFMKEEIPGVTSPMVYIAMMFSWFAWHVEDHDLHSLNYLHMGASKTWYGIPREAAVAFEEVVRIHGYGGEINPLVTFAVLGEKTTVLSPEVFIGAGVPCCRLVQNAGEFVVTFPRAYHTGFSHGFNCGEAANIATPEWLNIAKDAAIRRASINYPPMLSHYQLLYDLALALCSRIHVSINAEPRSSRLKVKKKGEGETMIKELFVQNVVQNNKLLQILGRGSSVVFLSQSSTDVSGTKLWGGFPPRMNPRLSIGFCSSEGFSKYGKGFGSRYLKPDQIQEMNQVRGFCSIKRTSSFSYDKNRIPSHDLFSNLHEGCENDDVYSSKSKTITIGSERESTIQDDGLSDQTLFSCVTCGILCFSCAAIIQPRESSANYLMSADCSFLNDWLAGSRATSEVFAIKDGRALTYEKSIFGDYHRMEKRVPDGLYDVPVQSVDYHDDITDHSYEAISGTETKKNTSALGLLALTYGNMSDSEEDQVEPSISIDGNEPSMKSCSSEPKYQPETTSLPSIELRKDGSPDILDGESACDRDNSKDRTIDCSIEYNTNEIRFQNPNVLAGRFRDSTIAASHPVQSAVTDDYDGKSKFGEAILPVGSETMSFVQKSDEDSSRLHVFCLEHAIQVEKQLREIGGVHILLYCHPDYPTIEGEAKALAEEMGMDYPWNAIKFQQANKEDEERIHSALDSEEAIPGNGDWAVKLGINLFYSANLCRSSLYSKQMPYNSVIYRAFGRSSSTNFSTKPNFTKKRSSTCRKAFVGKWCGKVWTSNQVHPLLNRKENEEEEEDDDDDLPFHEWEMPVERKLSRSGKSVANLTTKMTRSKRKLTSGGGSTKKKKRVCSDDVASDDLSPGDGSNQVHPLLSKKDYEGEGEEEEEGEEEVDEYESRFHTWEMSVERKSRGIRKFEPKSGANANAREGGSKRKSTSGGGSIKKSNKLRTDVVPDDLIEDLRRQRRRILRSKLSVERNSDNLSEENSSQLQKKISVGKLAKYFGTECASSDDSLVDHRPQRNKISIRSKKAKSLKVKSSFSDDSFGDDSNQHCKRICRSKKGKNIDGELSPSDESQGNYSPLHDQQVSGKRQNKYVDKEDGRLNEVEDTFLKYQRRASRSKQTKCVAMENDLSDHSLEHKSMSRIKLVKNFEKENTFSDENTPLQQSKRKSRSSQQRGLETEDRDTDGELEDSQPAGRILRSKQPNLKQVTPMHVKQRSRQSTKQESGPLVKIEASEKSKQSHSRLRNSKDKPKTRQSDSDTDEAIEDEPTKRLRKRTVKTPKKSKVKPKENKLNNKNKAKNPSAANSFSSHKISKAREVEGGEYPCDIEGCTMSFSAKQELILHKRNICPVKGCGKKFFSHKYLVQHRRVHIDDRPLKCPWKGCKMTFKWAWARTEHIRVHTGARPYVCNEAGCGQTFRFVSDFSRHKRKTGHSEKKGRG